MSLLVGLLAGLVSVTIKNITFTIESVLEKGIVLSNLNPTGKVSIHGEIWTAQSEESELKKGESIEVVRIENLKLFVKKS